MFQFSFKLFLLIMVFILSNLTLAQVNWTKCPDNPVLPGQPGTWYAYLNMSCVLYNADSSRYEMWFTCGAQAEYPYNIGYAWSTDGISWNVHSANPVLTPTSGEWDAYTVLAPFVLRENGQYKMWYTGSTANLLVRIGYATSPNGINWTKQQNPVLEPGTATWESGNVAYGCVMPHLNVYKMWYSGGSANFSQSGIGYATSPDGINWQKDTLNNPVLPSGAIGQWDRIVFGPRILFLDNIFYMFYTGEISVYQSDKVGLATSTDGIHNWNKHASNPVVQPTPGQWDGSRTILGGVLMDADTLKMYYAGSNGSNWGIGLATSFPFIPIPVELISFTATSDGKEVILKWSTATELNNQLFEIQRSFEGSDFASVGFVTGKGTTTERQDYTYKDKILVDGKYSYRLKQIDYLGRYDYSDIIEIELRLFKSYLLEQNYPNPFNPTTTIGYGIKEKCNVKVTILNSIGEEVAMLVNEEKESGYHSVEFNASSLPSGVYFYQLRAGDFIQTKKMILMK